MIPVAQPCLAREGQLRQVGPVVREIFTVFLDFGKKHNVIKYLSSCRSCPSRVRVKNRKRSFSIPLWTAAYSAPRAGGTTATTGTCSWIAAGSAPPSADAGQGCQCCQGLCRRCHHSSTTRLAVWAEQLRVHCTHSTIQTKARAAAPRLSARNRRTMTMTVIDKTHPDYIAGCERGVLSAAQMLSVSGFTVEQSVKAHETDDDDSPAYGNIMCICHPCVRDGVEMLRNRGNTKEQCDQFWNGFEAGVESCGCLFDTTCEHDWGRAEEAHYHRGHTAGSWAADNKMDKETWASLADDLKNETFKRGFEDGKQQCSRAMGT
jgi:hypothetical protein